MIVQYCHSGQYNPVRNHQHTPRVADDSLPTDVREAQTTVGLDRAGESADHSQNVELRNPAGPARLRPASHR